MSVIYSVQSFSPIKGGVRPDIPVPSTNEESAMRAAERRAASTAGAVVLCTLINEVGEVVKSEVLAVYGALPDYIIERLTI